MLPPASVPHALADPSVVRISKKSLRPCSPMSRTRTWPSTAANPPDEPTAGHERVRASTAVRGARDVRVCLGDIEVDPEHWYDHVEGGHGDVAAGPPRARSLVQDDVTAARQRDLLALRACGS